MDIDEIKALKGNMHATFDSPQGKEVLKYLEKICMWYPTIHDPIDTNSIVSRDAQRRIYGTIQTILNCSAEQLAELERRNNET